jgi:hypothetical protein
MQVDLEAALTAVTNAIDRRFSKGEKEQIRAELEARGAGQAPPATRTSEEEAQRIALELAGNPEMRIKGLTEMIDAIIEGPVRVRKGVVLRLLASGALIEVMPGHRIVTPAVFATLGPHTGYLPR